MLERCVIPDPRKIAVLRALKLGDLLCAIPALRALRGAYPEARISLIGLPWAREFVDRYRTYLDDFHALPGYPGLPEQEPEPGRMPDFLTAMRKKEFDLAIQLHGSGGISNGLIGLLGAKRTAGFCEPGSDFPDTSTFMPYPERGLELRRLLSLMEFLGIPSRGEELEFSLRPIDRARARSLTGGTGASRGGFVVLHPGASVAERRWPAANFSTVGDALASHGHAVLVTGSLPERGLTTAVVDSMRFPATDLAGRTDLGSLAAILADARLLVCNDTGVSHLADALEVDSVVISTGNNPDRWAPVDGRQHRVLCRASGVTPHQVIAEAIDLLGSPPDRPARFPWLAGSVEHALTTSRRTHR